MKAASGSSRSIITRMENIFSRSNDRTFSYFLPLERRLWYRYLRNSPPMVLRDIERLNRTASFEEMPRSERFLVLFLSEPDLSASFSCRRWLMERASSVPLRCLRDPRLGLRGIVKKRGKGFGKSKATYKPRCHRRGTTVAVRLPSFPLSRKIFHTRKYKRRLDFFGLRFFCDVSIDLFFLLFFLKRFISMMISCSLSYLTSYILKCNAIFLPMLLWISVQDQGNSLLITSYVAYRYMHILHDLVLEINNLMRGNLHAWQMFIERK